MWKVVNTTNDRMKAHLHRLATKMLDAPLIGEQRLRIGQPVFLEDAHFEELKEQLEKWEAKGMLEFWEVDADGQPETKPEEGAEPATQPMKLKVPAPAAAAAADPQGGEPTDERPQEQKDESAMGELDRTADDNPAPPSDNPEPWAEASTTPESPEPSTTKKGPKKKLF